MCGRSRRNCLYNRAPRLNKYVLNIWLNLVWLKVRVDTLPHDLETAWSVGVFYRVPVGGKRRHCHHYPCLATTARPSSAPPVPCHHRPSLVTTARIANARPALPSPGPYRPRPAPSSPPGPRRDRPALIATTRLSSRPPGPSCRRLPIVAAASLLSPPPPYCRRRLPIVAAASPVPLLSLQIGRAHV